MLIIIFLTDEERIGELSQDLSPIKSRNPANGIGSAFSTSTTSDLLHYMFRLGFVRREPCHEEIRVVAGRLGYHCKHIVGRFGYST